MKMNITPQRRQVLLCIHAAGDWVPCSRFREQLHGRTRDNVYAIVQRLHLGGLVERRLQRIGGADVYHYRVTDAAAERLRDDRTPARCQAASDATAPATPVPGRRGDWRWEGGQWVEAPKPDALRRAVERVRAEVARG